MRLHFASDGLFLLFFLIIFFFSFLSIFFFSTYSLTHPHTYLLLPTYPLPIAFTSLKPRSLNTIQINVLAFLTLACFFSLSFSVSRSIPFYSYSISYLDSAPSNTFFINSR
nr:uncharacterized protein SPBC32F12.17 [Schizosaccharomyces pombe]G2TRR2.1 RecName: Full=Putative uncharacterized transmembrane protein SPBC32F12.17 [Schizosaccharomyces pombe 972h-]CCD31375.1 dubious [Schizosaccharomyces pombe]|eukprot:NP_001343165.1 uncharacterized protein SPBC32F12.17 [Schizosaccharomyces pombe]